MAPPIPARMINLSCLRVPLSLGFSADSVDFPVAWLNAGGGANRMTVKSVQRSLRAKRHHLFLWWQRYVFFSRFETRAPTNVDEVVRSREISRHGQDRKVAGQFFVVRCIYLYRHGVDARAAQSMDFAPAGRHHRVGATAGRDRTSFV